MIIEKLLHSQGAWLAGDAGHGAVISTRVRLARNLADTPFPGWAQEPVRQAVWDRVHPVVAALDGMQDAFLLAMNALDEVDKRVLCERHLISLELAERADGCGVVARRDETVSVMINEEDHLRLQTIRPGNALPAAWRELDALDSELGRQLPYAFSARLGYLTACPSNVGTGLRASAMLHLPGLTLMNEMEPIVRGLGKIGLTVRGVAGEGTEACGNLFQVSNQMTLGEREQGIVKRLDRIVTEIEDHESNARARLLEKRERIVYDYVGRAYGVLRHAEVLSSKEALYLLSGLRLGLELGVVDKLDLMVLNQLMLLMQPGHLQRVAGKRLAPEERDELRAETVRRRLRGAALLR